jgi:hypothetical protein
MLVVSVARSLNNYPTVLAQLLTEAPLQLQVLGLIGIGLVGLTISAVLVGLVLGSVPQRLSSSWVRPDSEALRLGVAVGIFGAAASAGASALRSPAWAQAPDVTAAGAAIPLLQSALTPITQVLMASAILLPTMVTVDRWTSGWTRRRFGGGAMLAMLGFAAVGVPEGLHVGGWALSVVVIVAALVIAYATVLRFDPTMVPIALGTMTALGALVRAADRPYPGAVFGIAAGGALAWLVSWWWFRALRRARPTVGQTQVSAVGYQLSDVTS